MRGHSPPRGENAPGGVHPTHVLGGCLDSHQNDISSGFVGFLRLAGREDDLSDCRPRRSRQPMGNDSLLVARDIFELRME